MKVTKTSGFETQWCAITIYCIEILCK